MGIGWARMVQTQGQPVQRSWGRSMKKSETGAE